MLMARTEPAAGVPSAILMSAPMAPEENGCKTAPFLPWLEHDVADAMVAPAAVPSRVIALHCSGSGAGQWRQLGAVLGPGYELITPEHYGCRSTGHWIGAHAFTLADEAARIAPLVDTAHGKVHLVGHSYGGGVALHMALMRPHRIASLTLYEPSAFHLLKQIGDGGREALAEIVAVARAVGRAVISGDYRGGAESFVDYWGGKGAWRTLRPEVQTDLVEWLPKAPLDFAALIEEPADATAYSRLDFPVLVLRGEHAPRPSRLIAETLPKLLPEARLAVVAGAGHLGPLTHTAAVNELIVRHLDDAEAGIRHDWIAAP